jgi:L-alanine-DL-glutamate epimerase-like enolase superfamily enzyme
MEMSGRHTRREFLRAAAGIGAALLTPRALDAATTSPQVKIAKVEAFPLIQPLLGRFKFFEGGPPGRPSGRGSVLVKITADSGTVGWGQSVPVPKWSYETLESVYYTIARYLGPELVGCDPFDGAGIETMMSRAIAPSFSTGQPICKAGIDLALFDLTGRLLGQSAAQRWGRKGRDRLPISYTLNPRTLEDVETLIAQGRAKGHKHST